VVVYKIDRLTRSLADFAKLVEKFDERSISFVAPRDVSGFRPL
jgi:site-specific DNA recombinase